MTVVPLVLSLSDRRVNQASGVARSGRGRPPRHHHLRGAVERPRHTPDPRAAGAVDAVVRPAVAAALRPRKPNSLQATGGGPARSPRSCRATPWLPPRRRDAAAGDLRVVLGRADPDRPGQARASRGLLPGEISDAMIVIVRWVLWVAPVGIFSAGGGADRTRQAGHAAGAGHLHPCSDAQQQPAGGGAVGLDHGHRRPPETRSFQPARAGGRRWRPTQVHPPTLPVILLESSQQRPGFRSRSRGWCC